MPFSTPFFYGWVVVAVSALATYFSGPGQTYSISEFIGSYVRDVHLSLASVSELYSVATLTAGFALFGVGKILDRYGARWMATTATLGLAAATLWSSRVSGPIGLFIGFLFLRLCGQGSLSLIPSAVVPQWFVRRRGRAISFMSMGGLISAASLPVINTWLIQTWNWHIAWRVWTVLLVAVMAPLAFLLLRDSPEQVGLNPDGDPDRDQLHAASPGGQEISWTLREAARTPAFWLVLFCAFIPSMVSTGLTFNLFSILHQHGIGRSTSAVLLSVVPIIGFGSTLVGGFLLERVRVTVVLALNFLLKLAELLVLYEARSSWEVVLFIVMWGTSQGFLSLATKIIWPDYFGRRYLGSILSVSMVVMVIGSAFGPVPFGWAYDHFHSYQQILLAMTVLPFLGILAALAAKRPIKRFAV